MKFDLVGVAGQGFMGRGITASFLGAGLQVIAVDTREESLKGARLYIEAAMGEMASHGASQQPVPWADRLRVSTSLAELAECAFVVESVTEDLAIKRAVFDEIENVVAADVPIASNTSALPITLLQQGRRHPSRFLGMHWTDPAYATRFLEIIRGDQTSDAVISAAMELGHATEKDPCIVNRDIQGFIANRLGYAMYREAANLLEMGIGDVETIDRAFRNAFGLWATLCGPFRWIDITGGPGLYAKVMGGILPTLSGVTEVPASFREQRGRFYKYEDGDDARWQKLLHEHAWEVRRLQQEYYPLTSGTETP
jgi:3-hydroxybutyryl-CoA dehydrogenase